MGRPGITTYHQKRVTDGCFYNDGSFRTALSFIPENQEDIIRYDPLESIEAVALNPAKRGMIINRSFNLEKINR